jgi:sugar phosphate isomerase/epimerase
MKRSVELVASGWTIAGNCYAGGPTEVSPFDFRDRVETAHRVGYCGIGFIHADVMAVSERLGYKTMKRILDDNDMKYVEVEIIGDWFTDGEKRRRSDVVRRNLLKAAEALGTCHIKIGGDIDNEGRNVYPMDRMISELRVLAAEAADAGTKLALELMPFTNLRTIDQGVELIKGAGATNAGLMLDIWHMARGNIDFESIRTTPREIIFWVELDDARPKVEGTLYNDTIHNRELQGNGALDIQRFLKAVQATGYDNPYGVEILSWEHRLLPLPEAAQRAYDAAMRQFEPSAQSDSREDASP